MLVEAAQCYTRGTIGFKSKDLKQRQSGNPSQVIAYADKVNERLRRKFYRMTLQNGTKRNIAATAIARELACFMWGLMTNNIEREKNESLLAVGLPVESKTANSMPAVPPYKPR